MIPRFFPDQIESARLLIKKHQIESAETMFRCIDEDRIRLREFLPWVDATKTKADTEDFIRLSEKQWEEKSTFSFAIYLKDNLDFVGNIGIHAISFPHERGEIGYWIRKDYEGQGLMSEAVKALHEAAFNLGFHRVEIRCSSANQRSSNVPRRLGYSLDGVLRADALEYGTRRDTLIFSKLKDEDFANSKAGLLHHVEIYVSDLTKTKEFWVWFLSQFGYEVVADWDQGLSIKYKETYLTFVQTEEKYKSIPYHRCGTGLNHLAFHAQSHKQVDDLTKKLKSRGVKILYEDQHPYAGGEDYYAVFFEDPDRIKVEVVADSL